MNLFEAAMKYIAGGLAVIPIWRDARKNPHLSTFLEYTERLPTVSEWRRWANRWPAANLGAITGYWRNYVALDFDDQPAFDAWAAGPGFGVVGQTWQVATRRGYHVWFQTIDDPGSSRKYVCSNRQAGRHEVLLRARGGYCIVPPSVHHSGARYQTVHKVPPLLVGSISHYLEGWEEIHRRVLARPDMGTKAPELQIQGIPRLEDLIAIPERSRPNGRGAYQVVCPFHDDGRPSAWLNVREQKFGCNACWPGLWFDQVNVYAMLKGLSNGEAYKQLAFGDTNRDRALDPAQRPHR